VRFGVRRDPARVRGDRLLTGCFRFCKGEAEGLRVASAGRPVGIEAQQRSSVEAVAEPSLAAAVFFGRCAGGARALRQLQAATLCRVVVGRYARIELLVVDELGYLALPDGAADLVFQVISERNERASLIITTNLPFGDWTRVFADPRLAKAVVDRLTHRALRARRRG
jgi:hypothetical protein